MLIIRKEQMIVLSNSVRKIFKNRVISFLKKNMPTLIVHMNPPELEAFVYKGVDTAKIYNIKSELYIFEFIQLMLFLGQDFENHPDKQWAHTILVNEKLKEGTKLLQLKTHTAEFMEKSDTTSEKRTK